MPPAHPFDFDAVDGDKLHEECGVFGVIGVSDAANFVALGLHALQHRGQEAGGIVFKCVLYAVISPLSVNSVPVEPIAWM